MHSIKDYLVDLLKCILVIRAGQAARHGRYKNFVPPAVPTTDTRCLQRCFGDLNKAVLNEKLTFEDILPL